MTVTDWTPAEIALLGNINDPKPRQPKADKPHSWQPVDLLGAALNPPAPPSIEGIVYPGRRHVFSGEPESLKSWALMCLYVAEMKRGKSVVHINCEMDRHEIYERMTQLGASVDDLTERLSLIEPSEPMTTPHVREYMDALLSLRRPSIIGVDAFTGMLSMHNVDPNDNQGIDRWYMSVAKDLRQYGAALCILDHLPKSRENRGKYAIGGERKIGACDTHLGFAMSKTFGRGQHGRATITVHKDRPGHLSRDKDIMLDLYSDAKTNAVTFKWHFEERIVHISGDWKPTGYMERVSKYLGQCATPPTQGETEDAIGGKREYTRAAIEILIRDGYVRPFKNERNERALKQGRPYREQDDPASDKYVKPPVEAPVFEGDKDIPF